MDSLYGDIKKTPDRPPQKLPAAHQKGQGADEEDKAQANDSRNTRSKRITKDNKAAAAASRQQAAEDEEGFDIVSIANQICKGYYISVYIQDLCAFGLKDFFSCVNLFLYLKKCA